MVEPKKPKPSENKAMEVETNQVIEKLWAEYGKLSAEREAAMVYTQQLGLKMNEIRAKMNKAKQ